MKTLALSGWGQPADALLAIAPDALHLDYAQTASVEQSLGLIPEADCVIGWSMGGQMAIRAIAEKRIAPRFLVLIATPFQFLESDALKLGMGRGTFAQYRDNMARDPKRTLRKSYALIAHGDERAERVRSFLSKPPPHDWLYWLDALAEFSCAELDFSLFPPTLIIHGEADAVIAPEHARVFHQYLPRAELMLLKGCGHAPHWHNPEMVKGAIARHVQR